MPELSKPSHSIVVASLGADAALFRRVALITSLVVVAFSVADYLAGGDIRGWVMNALILLAAMVALAINRVGKLQAAYVTFGWGAWLGVSVQVLLTGSVDNTALYAYPVVILVSGWLLGLGHGYALTAASVVTLLGLAWMENHGIQFMPVQRLPWGRALDISVILIVSTLIVHRLIRHQQAQAARLLETVAHLTASQQQLNQAESRFAAVGDLIPAPLSLTNAATGEITYVNKAWEKVLGWTLPDVLGKSPLAIGVWHEPASREAFGDEFRRNGCVRYLEMTVQARDGTLIPVSVSADSVEQDGQRLTMSLLYDLTERKLVESHVLTLNAGLEARVAERTLELKGSNDELSVALSFLKHAQQELVQAEKMSALGGMVAGVAHELNTPIGNAMVVASTLHARALEFEALVAQNALKRSVLNAFATDCLEGSELVQRSLKRASDLVASFKQVAVDQTSERRRSFALHELVGEILTTLSPNLKKRPWQIDVDIPTDITLDSFPGPLGQVTINLVMNAALHAFDGREQGHIAINARLLDEQTIEMVFADDGVGIAPELMGRIFDPFFTTRLGQGGSGLGLTIVHQMVTQVLGGKVSVESTLGTGSRFTLRLPRAIAQPGSSA